MKFDKFGTRVIGSSNVQIFNGLSPELLNEFRDLGIKNSSVHTIADTATLKNSGKAFSLLLKITKSQQGGLAA